MKPLVLKLNKAITPLKELHRVALVMNNQRISHIIPWEEAPQSGNILEIKEGIGLPGFIDIHIHGYGGYDLTGGEEKDFLNIAQSLVKHGVTSFYPTTLTCSPPELLKSCQEFKKAQSKEINGSQLLGLHLEGPYISSEEERGAQDIDFIRAPDLKELKSLLNESRNEIKRITLAPEVKGALNYIKKAKTLGIVIAAGHTSATYEEAIKGFEAGITLCNHLYNGMKVFHHRKPGIIGACFSRKEVYAEIIADMLHLHPVAIEIALKVKGKSHLILVTDSISAAGLPDGEYMLGGLETEVKGGVSRLKESGRLAGSTLTMEKAVENMVKHLKVNLKSAVRMATLNPAQVMNLRNKGRLAPGYDADITVIDSNFNVLYTLIKGKVVYRR